MIEVFVEQTNKYLELVAKTGYDLLTKLSINSQSVILVRNGEVVLPEEELFDGDKVDILSVISGG